MSYFDTTVFNRIAQQQKETNDLLRDLIKIMKEQESKGRYRPIPTFDQTPQPQPFVPPVFYQPVPVPKWPEQNPYTVTCAAEPVPPAVQEQVDVWPFPTTYRP